MKKIVMVHGRPSDHDCFDGFAARYSHLVEFVPWREVKPGADLYVSCLQDPVRPRRAAFLESVAGETLILNHPHQANLSQRQFLYHTWRMHNLLCPEPPCEFDYEVLKAEARYPYFVKDLSKQLGRGYVIQNEKRLDWLYLEATRFDIDKYWSSTFVDTVDKDGFYVMQRYVVCGNKVIPGMLSKTKKWNCKSSHMAADIKHWSEDEQEQYVDELKRFWQSTPPNVVLNAVHLAGLDFCTVDCTLVPREGGGLEPMFWELNPMLNLSTDTVIGKERSWWRFFANYLFDTDEEIVRPSAREQVTHFMEHKPSGHWANIEKEK